MAQPTTTPSNDASMPLSQEIDSCDPTTSAPVTSTTTPTATTTTTIGLPCPPLAAEDDETSTPSSPSSGTSTPSATSTTTPSPTQTPNGKKIPYTGLPTANPNETIIPGQMRSDREELPEGFTKEEADRAEIREFELQQRQSAVARGPAPGPDCQQYWPSDKWVCGAIRDKYNSLGAQFSFLLWPTSDELVNPDGFGRRQTFTNGPIYWSAAGGAHPVVNHFFAAWARHGYEGGYIGYPTTDEIVNADGIGRRQEFTGAAIYWRLNEAYSVGGAIRDKWNSSGAETAAGLLGYPITDEVVLPDGQGRMNRFERGVIYWSSATDAHPVTSGIFTKWEKTGLEAGRYGYPTADSAPFTSTSAARSPSDGPGAVETTSKQDFQGGPIGDPLNPDSLPGYDWDEDYIDDDNCFECGDDATRDVLGFQPTSPFSARIAEDAPSAPDNEAVESDNMAGLPNCDTVSPDLSAPASEDYLCFVKNQEPIIPGTQDAPEAARTAVDIPGGPAIETDCYFLMTEVWGGDRLYQCMQEGGQIQTKNTQSGAITGKVNVLFEYELRTKYNSTTYDARAAVHASGATGKGTGLVYSGEANCIAHNVGSGTSANCNITGNKNFEGKSVETNANYVQDFKVEVPVGAGNITSVGIAHAFNFTHPSPDVLSGDGYRSTSFAAVRCDAVAGNRGTSGCIADDEIPILDFKGRGAIPAVSVHVGYAQASGLPGGIGMPPLTRTSDSNLAASNRDASCNRVRQARPAGQSCDEYPFASTYEGGASDNTGRTYGGCLIDPLPSGVVEVTGGDFVGNSGYSMCILNARQNSRAGGIETWFFTKNRVLDGDKFRVRAGS